MFSNLKYPIVFVSNDAGAANHIIAWATNYIFLGDVFFYFQGPARTILNKKLPNLQINNNLERAIEKSNTLICGTGWQTDIEYNALNIAKNLKIKSIAVLDHWINYKSRFVRNNIEVLPNEIWVTNTKAYLIALHTFPDLKILIKDDTYTSTILKKIDRINNLKKNKLLYILEPARSNWKKNELGEFQAFQYMLDNWHKLNVPDNTEIILRPHPSDPPNKYNNLLKIDKTVIIDQNSLEDSISEAKWVCGCSSFALFIALKAQRKVFSCLPPWAPPCSLPFKEIIHLKNL
jgi:hypothetical protein